MRTCKNPKCNTKLGRYATSPDGLCRDCRGPKGAKTRVARKKRQIAIKPKKFCDCGEEISFRSRTGKCKPCQPKRTFPCANPHCETRVSVKDSFCRACYIEARHDSVKEQFSTPFQKG